MSLAPFPQPATPQAGPSLQVYLLGSVDFEALLAFQRRLVYHVGGDRASAALVLCEHPPLISVGREGSRAHILTDAEELRARQWPVRWVNRGGGCFLHLPGQLAVYPVLALDRLGLGLRGYLGRLQQVFIDTLDEFGAQAHARDGRAGVWAGNRLIAGVGVAVRDWVSYFGAVLNVNVPLDLFKLVHCDAAGGEAMTSLERERRGPLRPSLVRERLVEHFARHFDFPRLSLFSDHPSLRRKAPSNAFAPRP